MNFMEMDDGPMLLALHDVDKTDGQNVLHGLATNVQHASREMPAATHQQCLRPQTCTQKAQLSDRTAGDETCVNWRASEQRRGTCSLESVG